MDWGNQCCENMERVYRLSQSTNPTWYFWMLTRQSVGFPQCARRWKDEHDFQQVLNGAKYLSALISTAMKVAYRQSSGVWLFAYVASSFISSFFGIYWDLVKDWGLMQSKSVNPWLRDHLLLKHKFAYYISIVCFQPRHSWKQRGYSCTFHSVCSSIDLVDLTFPSLH